MGIVFGVFAAVFWGVGDFLITHLTRRVGTSLALVTIQVFSLLAWVMWVVATQRGPGGDAALWSIVVLTALCHVLGLVFVYRAFEVGTLSIVSPISAGFAVVTAVLALIGGERPPVVALAGAAVLIVGVVFATRAGSSAEGRSSMAGVPEAILSALAFGTMFWLFSAYVEPKLGYAWPLVLLKTLAVTSSLWVLVSQRKRGGTFRMTLGVGVVLLALGAAAADTLAWLTYIWGAMTSFATVVTALASLFSAVTVLLAWRFMRERLAIHQWAGIAMILLGIFLVSM